jgi:hypothetical protein
MAFWSTNTLEPLRKFRFQVTLGEVLYHAKTVTKPSFDVSQSEYQLINHKIKYPGIATWNDIDVTIVDSVDKKLGVSYYNKLVKSGYSFEGKKDGIVKQQYNDGDILIEQIDAEGLLIETWTLKNAFIKGIKFGDLDYSSDDLMEITITIAYDSAELVDNKAENEARLERLQERDLDGATILDDGSIDL